MSEPSTALSTGRGATLQPVGRRLPWSMRPGLLILAMLALPLAALAAACSDDDDAGEVIDGDGDDAESLDVDNCTLLTDSEVSTLSDEPLFASEDGPLGCGWLEEGGAVAQFSIRAFRSDSSAADYAAELAPGLEVVELSGVGDEAVALASDGEVNFIVARKGDLFVEMVLTFLDMEAGSENLRRAGDLAGLALQRLEEAA